MNSFEIFKQICKIPHCSKKSYDLRDFIENFCLENGFSVFIDSVGNILAKKGMPTICLQSHYDMVCVGKAPNIEIVEKDGYIMAKESSLGADNGVGVALMLWVSTWAENVELLFTNDEEIGMIGAKNLSLNISSRKILNLDTEEEGSVFVGCAGGVDVTAVKTLQKERLSDELVYEIVVDGLPGGHSGVDIDKNIPNAIKVLFSYLSDFYPKLLYIEGGEALNSIPKNAKAIIATNKKLPLPKNEHIKTKETNFMQKKYMADYIEIIDTLNAFCDGVRGYDKNLYIPSKSVNLSKIGIDKEKLILDIFPRANSNRELEELKREIASFFSLSGFKVEFSHQFGAWKPEINEFAKEVCSACKDVLRECKFAAIHAGLECGVLLEKLKDGKMIASIGPNIFNPHSVREKCEIESIYRLEKIIKKLVR